MNPILRNVLAVIAGVIVGSIVNMGIVILSTLVVPLPEGVDPMVPESFKENIHLFGIQHWIGAWLAHAIGTLVGAFTTAKIAGSHQMKLALVIGAFFLLGGIMNSMDLGSSMGFNIVDWLGAYIPMAWIGWKLAGGNKSTAETA